jgi:hypothetical protein
VLAALSLAAALVHAAAAAAHDGALAWLLAAVALAQGAWAVVVLERPRRRLLAVGALGNVVVLAAYVTSRTVGLAGLEAAEPVGRADLIAATFEALIVVLVALLLSPRSFLVSYRRIGPATAVVAVALVALAALPGIAGGGHDHGHEHDAATGHEHGAGSGHVAGAAHEHASADTAGRGRAAELVAATRRHAPRWASITRAEADGYRSMRFGPVDHLVDWVAVDDRETLDPRHPEALVYVPRADGTKKLVAVMYVAPWSATTATVPDIAGASWHTHDDLCWDDAHHIVDFAREGGSCVEGTLRSMPPMLHVSLVDNACGPFGDPTTGRDRATRSLMGRFGDAMEAFGAGLPIVATSGCAHDHPPG